MRQLLFALFTCLSITAFSQITLTPNSGCAGTTFNITITGSTSSTVGTPCSAVTGVYQNNNRVIAIDNPAATQASPPVTVTVTIPQNFTAGTYDFTVKYQYSNSCYTGSCTNCFTVIPKPTSVSVQPTGSLSKCEGETVNLTCTATGATSYQWQRNSNDIQNATNTGFSATTTGAYACIATNQCGNTSSDVTNITFNALPTEPVITANGAVLSSNASGSLTYIWYKDGNVINGASASTYIATGNGTYAVEVTDGNGCSAKSADFNYTQTGINDLIESTIKLTPNPATSNLTITTGFREGFTAFITSYDGRIVSKLTSVNETLVTDVSTLSKGIYLVKIKSGNTEVQKRLTIQ